MTDDELWDIRARGSAAQLFADSCLHLLRSAPLFATVETTKLESEVRVGLLGIGAGLVCCARPCRRSDDDMCADFQIPPGRVEMVVHTASGPATDHWAVAAAGAIAAEVRIASTTVSVVVTRETLEAAVTDWLGRWGQI